MSKSAPQLIRLLHLAQPLHQMKPSLLGTAVVTLLMLPRMPDQTIKEVRKMHDQTLTLALT